MYNNFQLFRKHLFQIKFISDKDCFLHFPAEWIRNNPGYLGVPLRMQYAGSEGFFSAHPGPSSNNDPTVVCINALFAQKLQIEEGISCVVELADDNARWISQPAQRVHVTPSSLEDEQMLHFQSDLLQSMILDQVRVVYPAEKLVLWSTRTLHISITIDTINDNAALTFGTLEQSSEIYITGNSHRLYAPVPKEPKKSSIRPLKQPELLDEIPAEFLTEDDDILPGPPTASTPSSPTSLISISSTFESEFEDSSDSFKDLSSNSESIRVMKSLNHPDNMKDEEEEKPEPSVGLMRFLNNYLNWVNNPKKEHLPKRKQVKTNYNLLKESLLLNKRSKKRSLFRVQLLPYEKKNALYQMNYIWIHRKNAKHLNPESIDTWKNKIICQMESIKTDTRPIATVRYVRLLILEDINRYCQKLSGWIEEANEIDYSKFKPVFVTKNLLKDFNFLQGDRVFIQSVNKIPTAPALFSLEILIKYEEKTFVKSSFFHYIKSYTDSKNDLLINTNSLISLDDKYEIILKIIPSNIEFLWLKEKTKEDLNLQWECNSNNPVLIRGGNSSHEIEKNIPPFVIYPEIEKIIINSMQDLEFGLGIGPHAKTIQQHSSPMNILIAGQLGTGKSLLAKYICSSLKQFPRCVHNVYLACRPLKGKRSDALHTLISESLDECVAYQPSILILDDIDSIICPGSNLEAVQEDSNFIRVSELIKELLSYYQQSNAIGCIATATSLTATIQALETSATPQSSRGQHLFPTVYELPELSKKARCQLLKFFLSERDRNNVLNIDTMATQTEGFSIQDLYDLIIRIVFESFKRNQASSRAIEPHIDESDLNKALTQISPAALRGVNLVKDSDGPDWDDVGGLKDIKEILVQMLQWPTLYADLMNKCPLRRPSGVLLYGAPGTGKTLLAAAVARSCKLNFINVKGPELLSKYIGASEEAVRNIFQKAIQARPCVLFFDEFDALAPRRGHDSTGVTDRVVNQLLTALDGVDTPGSGGVRVLAATGRPDLIDPALLRPGRLDRVVYVPLPDTVDARLNILQALTRHDILLNPAVNLIDIANLTEGMTGADLQAVLYTAQIKSYEAQTKSNSKSKELPVLNPSHLIDAIRETRPSLTKQDRLKYKSIYDSFQQSRARASTGAKNVPFIPKEQRVTLA